MKVETVEQYKILEYINKNFNSSSLELTLLDRSSIGIQDNNGERAVFKYEDGEVRMIL